jgi:hypothetical protein
MAMVKGAGVDCAQLLHAVFHRVGLIPALPIAPYSHQWHLHRSEEHYLRWVERCARRIAGPPLPADLALWRIGRCFAHGAIVLDWPRIVHAHHRTGCLIEDAECAQWLSRRRDGRRREVLFFRYAGWP